MHIQLPAEALSRRTWLSSTGRTAVAASLVSLAPWRQALAAEPTDSLNRFPRMVHNHFVRQVRALEQISLQQKEALRTKEDAVAYVEAVRQKIRLSFGPEPPRTPLNPRVAGVVERDGYRIEKVIFESRPGFLVTANLYVPTGRQFPVPGVVGACGHGRLGKAAEAYQSFAQGLARLGNVCLIYDPIGQGERLQYVNDDLTTQFRGSVHEHIHIGNQQALIGEFFGMWRAWDGIRALDYLLSREEVDPRHVGVTGSSGGGTLTTWLAGLDRRWTMAAPSCFVTTFRRNLENELPADSEQCPPQAFALGLDHDDFLAAMAPKPVVILAQEKDFFDIRGTEEAYLRLKRLYALLGAEENISMFVDPKEHGYWQESRVAMYRWFSRASGTSIPDAEPKITLEDDKTLWCTPNGQIAELKPRTVFQFTRARSEQLAKTRGEIDADALTDVVRQVLKLPQSAESTPSFQVLRAHRNSDYPRSQAATYAVQTEPGISALVYRLDDESRYSRPPTGQKQAILYVSHQSADLELRSEQWLQELIEANADAACFSCDVRGIGESQADTCNDPSFESAYGADYFYAAHSLMLSRPYVGQKTWDVMRVLDWLGSFGAADVHLVAKGWATPLATFAALFREQVTQLTLHDPPASYQQIAESEHYDWPLSAAPAGVLAHFDLPDCYRALQARLELHML